MNSKVKVSQSRHGSSMAVMAPNYQQSQSLAQQQSMKRNVVVVQGNEASSTLRGGSFHHGGGNMPSGNFRSASFDRQPYHDNSQTNISQQPYFLNDDMMAGAYSSQNRQNNSFAHAGDQRTSHETSVVIKKLQTGPSAPQQEALPRVNKQNGQKSGKSQQQSHSGVTGGGSLSGHGLFRKKNKVLDISQNDIEEAYVNNHPSSNPTAQQMLGRNNISQELLTVDHMHSPYLAHQMSQDNRVALQKREPILSRLRMEVWLWEKEQSHRLFNFHEGFRVDETPYDLIGSNIIVKKPTLAGQTSGRNEIQVKRARDYIPLNKKSKRKGKQSESSDSEEEDNDKLVNVVYNEGSYFLHEPGNKDFSQYNIIDNYLWFAARFMPQKRIEVKEGDVIRFGRIPFKVAKLVLDPNAGSSTGMTDNNSIRAGTSMNDISQDDLASRGRNGEGADQASRRPTLNISALNNSTFIEGVDNQQSFRLDAITIKNPTGSQPGVAGGLRGPNNNLGDADPMKHGGTIEGGAIESGKACRICLDEAETEENPFITPCKCDGSMKFIHLSCLQEWLDSKRVSQKLEGVYSYYWEELVCELCKDPLALNNISVTDKTKNTYLLNFKQPKGKKYMVLESDIECLSKAIHVIVFSVKNDFYVGRRINNDITISDISVSRKQAGIILKENNKVFVEDCDSKFGTFVKAQSPIKLSANIRLPIQIEKKIFFFKLESRFSCFQLCLYQLGFPVKNNKGERITEESYDHYPDVALKYPIELMEKFKIPLSLMSKVALNDLTTIPLHPNHEGGSFIRHPNQNPMLSSITQISAVDLSKHNGPGRGQHRNEDRTLLREISDSVINLPSEIQSHRSSQVHRLVMRQATDPYGMIINSNGRGNSIQHHASSASIGSQGGNPFSMATKLPPIVIPKNKDQLILPLEPGGPKAKTKINILRKPQDSHTQSQRRSLGKRSPLSSRSERQEEEKSMPGEESEYYDEEAGDEEEMAGNSIGEPAEDSDEGARVERHQRDKRKQLKKQFDKSKMFNRVITAAHIAKREIADDSESGYAYQNEDSRSGISRVGGQDIISVSDNSNRLKSFPDIMLDASQVNSPDYQSFNHLKQDNESFISIDREQEPSPNDFNRVVMLDHNLLGNLDNESLEAEGPMMMELSQLKQGGSRRKQPHLTATFSKQQSVVADAARQAYKDSEDPSSSEDNSDFHKESGESAKEMPGKKIPQKNQSSSQKKKRRALPRRNNDSFESDGGQDSSCSSESSISSSGQKEATLSKKDNKGRISGVRQ